MPPTIVSTISNAIRHPIASSSTREEGDEEENYDNNDDEWNDHEDNGGDGDGDENDNNDNPRANKKQKQQQRILDEWEISSVMTPMPTPSSSQAAVVVAPTMTNKKSYQESDCDEIMTTTSTNIKSKTSGSVHSSSSNNNNSSRHTHSQQQQQPNTTTVFVGPTKQRKQHKAHVNNNYNVAVMIKMGILHNGKLVISVGDNFLTSVVSCFDQVEEHNGQPFILDHFHDPTILENYDDINMETCDVFGEYLLDDILAYSKPILQHLQVIISISESDRVLHIVQKFPGHVDDCGGYTHMILAPMTSETAFISENGHQSILDQSLMKLSPSLQSSRPTFDSINSLGRT